MFLFPKSLEGSLWTSLRSWAFPWTPIPIPLDQNAYLLSDQEKKDEEQDQQINRDA